MEKNLEVALEQLDLRGTLLLINILTQRALELKINEDSAKKEPSVYKPNTKLTLATSTLMPSKMVM